MLAIDYLCARGMVCVCVCAYLVYRMNLDDVWVIFFLLLFLLGPCNFNSYLLCRLLTNYRIEREKCARAKIAVNMSRNKQNLFLLRRTINRNSIEKWTDGYIKIDKEWVSEQMYSTMCTERWNRMKKWIFETITGEWKRFDEATHTLDM